MSIDHRKLGTPSNVTKDVDLHVVGQEIYHIIYGGRVRSRTSEWKKRARQRQVEIKPDHLYSPREVAAVLSVSYDTATRIMGRMQRVADLAAPRSRKRLLRIKGSDLRAYIHDKLE